MEEYIRSPMNIAKSAYNSNIEQHYAKFLIELKKQTKIVFYMDTMGGTGHQASTIFLMLLMIDIWTKGDSVGSEQRTIELIYRNEYNKTTVLAALPELKENKPQINGVKVELKEKVPMRLVVPKYGFVCGFDNQINLASEAGVSYFLRLQPLFWWAADEIHYNDEWFSKQKKSTLLNNYTLRRGNSEVRPNDILRFLPADFRKLSYVSEPPQDPGSWESNLTTRQIKELLNDKNIELCTTYKIGEGANWYNSVPERLFNILTGFAIAMHKNVIEKDVVILNCSDNMKDSQLNYTKHLLDALMKKTNISQLPDNNTVSKPSLKEIPALLHEMQNKYQLNIVFRFADLNTYKKEVSTDKNNLSITLITIPERLPSKYFNYILAQCTLPPIFEGSGSASVAVTTGRPYLKVSVDHERHYLYLNSIANSILSENSASYCQAVANQVNSRFSERAESKLTPGEILAEFVSRCADETKDGLKQYFEGMAKFYCDPANNKLTLALGLFQMCITNKKLR